MGLSLEKPALIERRARRQPRRRHDLAKCIRETLLALGGEAHRKTVIEQLAREFGLDPRNVPTDLETSVIRTYETILRDEAQRAAFGFHLPFGAGSHRWGVKFIQAELPN
jgi:hypothetical protein